MRPAPAYRITARPSRLERRSVGANPQSFAFSAFFRGYLARGIGSGYASISPGARTTGPDCRRTSPGAQTISRDCASISPDCQTTGPDCPTISPSARTTGSDCPTISPGAQTTGPDCRTIGSDCRTIRPDCRTPGALVQEQAHGKWSFTLFWLFLTTSAVKYRHPHLRATVPPRAFFTTGPALVLITIAARSSGKQPSPGIVLSLGIWRFRETTTVEPISLYEEQCK